MSYITRDRNGGAPGVRRRLTAVTNFYVNSVSGNDANNGTSPARAKATLQAMGEDIHANYDMGDYRAIINLAVGTAIDPYVYGGIDIRSPFVGGGVMPPVEIVGDVVTPEKVVISTAGNAMVIHGANIGISGVKMMTDLSGGGSIIAAFAGANVFHDNIWFAGAGHECIEAHTGCTVKARGPSRVSGRYDSWNHFTENAQIIWEDYPIALVAADGVTLGVRDITDPNAGPRGQEYIFGGNRASCTLGRVDITGSFSAGLDPGDGITYLSRHFNHISATLNLSSVTGIDGLFPGYSPPQNEAGGRTVYDSGVGDIIYCRLDAIGNNADGYADNAVRAFLTFSLAAAYLAKRPPDQIFAAIPVIQCGPGTWPSFRPPDIPGVAVAILRGDTVTPSNCLISTTAAHCIEPSATQTLWIIEGFTMTSTGQSCMSIPTNSKIKFQNCVFGAALAGSHILQAPGSIVEGIGPFEVTGSAAYFLNSSGGRTILSTDAPATFTGAITYSSATVLGRRQSWARWDGSKTIGTSVTGTRVDLSQQAFLDTNNTTDQTSVPGSVDGPVDAGTFAVMV